MVSLTASADSLHLLAHRAQLGARSEEDWWDNPLDTALAAISATRHQASHRGIAEAATNRLRRWLAAQEPRRVSADAAALAIVARAAADLAQRDRELEKAAVEAVADMARRAGGAAPSLHLALAAWALDTVIADRDQRPWPELRSAAKASGARGLTGPLNALSAALASQVFDGPAVIAALLRDAPASPSAQDAAVVMWLLTVALERCASEVEPGDAGLRALVERRSELATRLAQELTQDAFRAPEVAEFDPEAEFDLRPTTYLSPTEALLLDISLASADPEDAWIRYEEGAELFGRRERAVRQQLSRRTAGLLVLVGGLAGAVLGLALTLGGIETAVVAPAGIALFAAFAFAAATVVHWMSGGHLSQALRVMSMSVCLAGAVDAVNASLDPPPLPDATGVIVGLLAGAVIVMVVPGRKAT